MSQPTHQAGEMDKKPAAKGPPPIKRQRFLVEAVNDTVPCLANNASALLTSSLLGEIVAHQIMAFLDPKEILVFLQTQPTICKKFHLDTFFCVQHGNRMEMKPSAMVWNGYLDIETPRKIIEGVVVTYVEKGTKQEHCIFHSETVPSLKCVECVMEAKGEQRCHDCSLFYPQKDYTFTCDDCEVTRCQFWCINEVIGDPGKCKVCEKVSCCREECTRIVRCDQCDDHFCINDTCLPEDFRECALCGYCQCNRGGNCGTFEDFHSCDSCNNSYHVDCFPNYNDGGECSKCAMCSCGNGSCPPRDICDICDKMFCLDCSDIQTYGSDIHCCLDCFNA
ncbi:hypothetical protein IV203_035651 [Nitzschia inconspicua]|uniref:Uncharacterized protein n=1 Tax=Nitzschia inconspicua TaxID=303405 RepID=A0A9K3PUV6_9STRA|nr:hypothetical protein IV203_035651 [Nitzschia inconspicua]